MNKAELLKKINLKPIVKDYTYAVLFLSISSFFAFFVVRPVLKIAFTLEREAKDLRKINAVYEANLEKVIQIQGIMETFRDRLSVVDGAIPSGPQTKNVVISLQQAASESGVTLENIDISGINLKYSTNSLNKFSVNVDVMGGFDQVSNFLNALISQRRLKTISAIKINRQTDTAGKTVSLHIVMVLDAYYL